MAVKPNVTKPSRSHLKFLREHGFTLRCSVPERDHLVPLKKMLLALGGHAVILPVIEEDLQKIMKRGWPIVPSKNLKVVMMRGEPSRCHRNAALCWEANPNKVTLYTGYALSKDGLWRQHSWLVNNTSGNVVETTEARIIYYGYPMTADEANEFYFDNEF
jgi:hypothetical protein